MSSFKAAFLAFCLFLGGCGFQPMYGDHSSAASMAMESGVEIGNIPDRNGQYLRNLLIDRMYQKGRPSDAPYLLTIAPLRTELTNLGIRKDATSTRAMLQVYTVLTLLDRTTNTVVLERRVRAVGGYNQLDNQFATRVSEHSVSNHMLEELSDTIVTEVSLYLNRAKGSTP